MWKLFYFCIVAAFASVWGLQAGLPGASLAHLCQLRIHRRASKISVSNGKFFGFALRDEKGRQIALPGRRLGSARDTYSFICNGNKAKVLGSGGNGMVFAATTSSGETVAIKKVRARLGMVNFKTWVPVNDISGVTNLKDLIRVGTDMYIVTEQSTAAYVDCFDYQSFNMPLSHSVIRKWILQVAVVVDQMHRRGVVHGDIKPENMLLFRGLNVKLADFDAAHLLKNQWDTDAVYGGTLRYMSREGLNGIVEDKRISRDAFREQDVWSLGVSLFFFLNDEFPFYPTVLMKDKNKWMKEAINFDIWVTPRIVQEIDAFQQLETKEQQFEFLKKKVGVIDLDQLELFCVWFSKEFAGRAHDRLQAVLGMPWMMRYWSYDEYRLPRDDQLYLKSRFQWSAAQVANDDDNDGPQVANDDDNDGQAESSNPPTKSSDPPTESSNPPTKSSDPPTRCCNPAARFASVIGKVAKIPIKLNLVARLQNK